MTRDQPRHSGVTLAMFYVWTFRMHVHVSICTACKEQSVTWRSPSSTSTGMLHSTRNWTMRRWSVDSVTRLWLSVSSPSISVNMTDISVMFVITSYPPPVVCKIIWTFITGTHLSRAPSVTGSLPRDRPWLSISGTTVITRASSVITVRSHSAASMHVLCTRGYILDTFPLSVTCQDVHVLFHRRYNLLYIWIRIVSCNIAHIDVIIYTVLMFCFLINRR
jgi:hypothetical protein